MSTPSAMNRNAFRYEEGHHDDRRPRDQTDQRMVRHAPNFEASQPKNRAPPKATNWTSRMSAMSCSWANQLLGPVDARGRDDGLDAVVEEEVREKEHQGLRILLEVPEGVLQLGDAAAHGALARRVRQVDLSIAGHGRAPQSAQTEHGDEGEQRPPQTR